MKGNPTLFALPNTFTPFAPAVAHSTPFCHIFFLLYGRNAHWKVAHVFACSLTGVVLEGLPPTEYSGSFRTPAATMQCLF
jgi:hypothetical protein